MADGVSDDGNGDEPIVLPTPAGCTDVQSLSTLLREEMRKHRQKVQEWHQAQQEWQRQRRITQQQEKDEYRITQQQEEAEYRLTRQQEEDEYRIIQQQADDEFRNTQQQKQDDMMDTFNVMLQQTKMMIAQIQTSNYNNNNNNNNNNRSSRNDECNYNDSALSIKSASSSDNTESSKANKYKSTPFENPTTNAELQTQPDQDKENSYHALVSTGTTRPRLACISQCTNIRNFKSKLSWEILINTFWSVTLMLSPAKCMKYSGSYCLVFQGWWWCIRSLLDDSSISRLFLLLFHFVYGWQLWKVEVNAAVFSHRNHFHANETVMVLHL